MLSLEIFFMGVALAVDASVVCFALGLLSLGLPPVRKLLRGFGLSLIFGAFQFLMLWLGSYAGFVFAFSSYGYFTQMVVALVFVLIGLKFYQESQKGQPSELRWGILPVLLLAVATSIDALAAGVSLGTLPFAHLAALEVGVITFLLCGVFYLLSQFFSSIPRKWLLRGAGLVFVALATRIVLSFYLKGNA
jgi:putative Mn2+ efflux pump MntP